MIDDNEPMTFERQVSNLHIKTNRIEKKVDTILAITFAIAAGLLVYFFAVT